jgi:hypothetical protein
MKPSTFPILLLLASLSTPAFLSSPAEIESSSSYRVAAFDSASDLLGTRSSAVLDVVDTRETWTKSEVRAGYQYEFAQVRDFASTARALLADAEKSLRECEHGSGSAPPVFDPPGSGLPPGSGAVLEYVENPPFAAGGLYDWLPDLSEEDRTGARLGGTLRIGRTPNGWKSSNGFTIPDEWSNDRVVWNSTKATWDEFLPKWGIRAYDVRGTIRNLVQFRAGDFTRGREGHGIYLNVFESLLLDNVHAIQCGGQAIQLVWRINNDDETVIPASLHDQASHKITVRDSSAVDCGAISEGLAVRSSWPLTFYNPGQDFYLIRFKVRTDLQPFKTSSGLSRSHGAVYIGPGQTQRTTKVVLIDELDVEVWESDRDEVRLESVASGLILSPRIIDRGGTAEIGIVDDCGRIEIRNALAPLTVIIRDKAKHRPLQSFKVEAGANFVWSSSK